MTEAFNFSVNGRVPLSTGRQKIFAAATLACHWNYCEFCFDHFHASIALNEVNAFKIAFQ